MARKNLFHGALVIALVFAFVLGGCNFTINGNNDIFVAVRNITGVPTATVAGTPLALTGTVTPSNATNKTIIWNIKDPGTTDASISGNILTTAAVGTVTVTATIVNGLTDSSPYTQDFAVGVGSGFVLVTGISGTPTITLVGNPLTLGGTVEPTNATNRTIVWSGSNVNNGVLTAASAGPYSVTATIANGLLESVSYTKTFDIEAYGAGSSGTNPFGDTTPFIWAMDNKGGEVYVTIWDNAWIATAEGTTYNSGDNGWIPGTKASQWTVTGGSQTGNTGLALIMDDGKMRVANFSSTYSDMNGTFTKLDTGLTLNGTWIGQYDSNHYTEIVGVDGGGEKGTFTSSDSNSSSGPWEPKIKGEYTKTNPAICTITEAYVEGTTNAWVPVDNLTWEQRASLDSGQKYYIDIEEIPMIIYLDRCEGQGVVFYKQQP